MEDIQDIGTVTSNRPKNNNFYQQNLWAWQPVLTFCNVSPYFFFVGLMFIPLGAFFLVTSNSINEVSIPYTYCITSQNESCADKVKDPIFYTNYERCPCVLKFTIDSDMQGPVHMFYGLTNYFQNHRRYVMSRDDDQLNGADISTPNANCNPYAMRNDKIIAPCGSIANSLFNDTFTVTLLTKKGSSTPVNQAITFNFDNIAWKSDIEHKFGIPPRSSWDKTTKPINWPLAANVTNPQAYKGFQQLIVWMRTAALPSFRKNYGDLEMIGEFAGGLPAGTYQLDVSYAYPVTQFGGTKRFIISTTNWLGGKNPTLGIAYIVVGCIHLLLAIIFVGIHCYLRTRRHFQS